MAAPATSAPLSQVPNALTVARLAVIPAFVVLFLADRLPWPALALIVGRDALLLGGYKLVAPRGYEFEVNALGKLATWVLYAALAFVMVTAPGTDWPLG